MEAQLLKIELEKKSLSCFLDVQDIKVGNWQQQIKQHLKSSQYLICILSKNTLIKASKNKGEDIWREEVITAMRNNIKIIPLALPDFNLDEFNILPIDSQLAKLKQYQMVTMAQHTFDVMYAAYSIANLIQ